MPTPRASLAARFRVPLRTARLVGALAVGLVLLGPALASPQNQNQHQEQHQGQHEGQNQDQNQGQADDEAARVAARSVEAMGGQEAWDATRFLRFDFFGFRTHHWDRHEGLHRLEGTTRDGDDFVTLLDLRSPADAREGQAFRNGELLTGDEAAEQLDHAWGAWVNDVYWLLMPLKLRDPGVHLVSEGTEDLDGTTYDKLKLTFEGVGLTPGDTYWAWFDQDTGLMHRWAYHLESWDDEREPTAWDWLDWQSYGDVKMSGTRRNVADGTERYLGDIAVFDDLPASVFTSPEPVE